MIKSRRIFLPLFAAVLAVFLSCTDFFSNSWASWAARDPDKLIPKVSASNVDELLKMAENDPDLSLAVLKKIQKAAKDASGTDQVKLQSAALGAAVNAVGLGQAVIGAAGKLTGIEGDNPEEAAKDLIFNAINDLKNLDDTSSLLIDLLPPPNSTAFDNFTKAASAEDLAMTAAVLIAGEAKKQMDNYSGNLNDYLDDLEQKFLDGDLSSLEESENLARAMAIATAIEPRQDELGPNFLSLLNGLHLLSNPPIPEP